MNDNKKNKIAVDDKIDGNSFVKEKFQVSRFFREKMRERRDDDNASERKKKLAAIRRALWAASFFLGIGVYLSSVVAVCIIIGMKCDEIFSSSPCGVVAGIFLGFPVAIYGIYADYQKYGK